MLAFLSLVLGRAGFAQELQPLEPEWLRQMYAEGWQKVQEGVLQRDTGGGSFETFGYGAEGLQWLVQSYEQQVQFFEDKYNESPSTEILELIEQLRDKVDSLNVELQAAPSAETFDGEVLEGCSLSYDATAYAGPQESPQGVTATASAYLHNDCEYVGNTTAYAYAQAIDGTLETYLTKTDPKNNGTWLDSYASASANGSTACESRAQATVEIPQLSIYYAAPPAENYNCPAVSPITASVSGPTSVTTDYYISAGCADVTWTASATGGHPGGYTYSWYIGTDPIVQGTGSTFTKSYCNTSQSVTVKVVASDSDGHTDDETYTTVIQQIGSVVASASGPTSVTTDFYNNSGCADVNWTASATGGHTGGYTYSWYIGTDPTVQGTGSTFTKSYCKTSQSVTVKVVARDSDGHTDDATSTTNISYKPAIVATISGPTSVTSSTSCTTVSWTVSASGTGHSGYSYKWYIGTTQQTTGTTFSKQFCSSGGTSQSITVKATATASDGHQDTDTHSMSISFPPPPDRLNHRPIRGFYHHCGRVQEHYLDGERHRRNSRLHVQMVHRHEHDCPRHQQHAEQVVLRRAKH
jgi:hypothetical protein